MADAGPGAGQPDWWSPQDHDRRARLWLLDGFRLTIGGDPVTVAPGGRRLLAFLALRERGAGRRLVAARLWPDTPDGKANANLRSALWRLQCIDRELLVADGAQVWLAPTLRVDAHEVAARARQLLDGASPSGRAETGREIELLSRDVLPDWWEDWVLLDRERFRQLRMHALERLCEQLTSTGRFPEALDAGLAAVAAEPLRETAHRRLIGVHLAEGNAVEARRQYESYRRLLDAELGCEPSPALARLVAVWRRRPSPI